MQLGAVRLVYRVGAEHQVSAEESAWRLDHDPLTGVASLACLRRRLSACDAAACPLSVIVVDIDRLPAWVAHVGEDWISDLFTALAGRLHALAGGATRGTVARLAWRSFVVVVEADDREAVHLAEEVRASIASSPLVPAWSHMGPQQSVTVATATRQTANEPWEMVVARAETIAGQSPQSP